MSLADKKVFISYIHDSPEHEQWVLNLANNLREAGIDAWIDKFVNFPEEGWPRWMQKQIDNSDFVLCVSTQTYKNRFEGRETPGFGLGVTWEGFLANQVIYQDSAINRKFIPIIPDAENANSIPIILRSYTHYSIPRDFSQLVQLIKGNTRSSNSNKKLQIKSQGLPLTNARISTKENEKGKIKLEILSPYNATVYCSPIISTKLDKQIKTWTNTIYSTISLLRDQKIVLPLHPFIILVEEKTNDVISIVAQTKLTVMSMVPNGTSVLINEPIASILYDATFKSIPWTISRGAALGGILKYRPRIEDPCWIKLFKTDFEEESEPMTIIEHKYIEDAGIEYIGSPTSGVLCDVAVSTQNVGSFLDAGYHLANILRGQVKFPVTLKQKSIMLEQITNPSEAVHVGQYLLKMRIEKPEINFVLNLHRTENDGVFILRSPIEGTFKISETNGYKIQPGKKVERGVTLCRIESEQIILNLSIDNVGKIMEVLPKDDSHVKFGEALMMFHLDYFYIRSVSLGIFYLGDIYNSNYYVKVGQKVKVGDKLYGVENNKQPSHVTSLYNCTIERIEVEDQSEVNFGQALFYVKLDN